jgi:hypothetical protein
MKFLVKCFLNTIIVLYVGIIYFTGVPESNTLNVRLKEKASKIAFAIGIWPSWSMFAPNPIRFDSKTYVSVTHRNGDTYEHDIEKPLVGILATFRKARWMKYSQDNLRSPNSRALLSPAIRYFRNKYNKPENPVVSVKIIRRWEELSPFSDTEIPSISKTPRESKNEILITESTEN